MRKARVQWLSPRPAHGCVPSIVRRPRQHTGQRCATTIRGRRRSPPMSVLQPQGASTLFGEGLGAGRTGQTLAIPKDLNGMRIAASLPSLHSAIDVAPPRLNQPEAVSAEALARSNRRAACQPMTGTGHARGLGPHWWVLLKLVIAAVRIAVLLLHLGPTPLGVIKHRGQTARRKPRVAWEPAQGPVRKALQCTPGEP